ncbi:hypothetical protein GQ55_7G015900 [Panicum hallii var. hallii]|uniref:Uncharacterized protein n=1 Tax=Panicum hallii var. hallii TaxID=1504633 RepID=A0A2T7CRV7_9POAL|nr:hypothetical protein GQ55_7G015900 [Panicum hallii var. hallii]
MVGSPLVCHSFLSMVPPWFIFFFLFQFFLRNWVRVHPLSAPAHASTCCLRAGAAAASVAGARAASSNHGPLAFSSPAAAGTIDPRPQPQPRPASRRPLAAGRQNWRVVRRPPRIRIRSRRRPLAVARRPARGARAASVAVAGRLQLLTGLRFPPAPHPQPSPAARSWSPACAWLPPPAVRHPLARLCCR